MDKLALIRELRRLALVLDRGAEMLPKRTPEVLRQAATLIEEGNRKKKTTPLTELGLSAHAYSALYRHGWRGIEDVKTKSERTLLRIPGIGKATVQEIREAVARYEEENKENETTDL